MQMGGCERAELRESCLGRKVTDWQLCGGEKRVPIERDERERERERERALWERERETTYAAHTAVLPCLGLRPQARGSA
jgi:hypothetical protein